VAAARQLQGFAAVVGFASDLQIHVLAEELAQPGPHDGVVVNDAYLDHGLSVITGSRNLAGPCWPSGRTSPTGGTRGIGAVLQRLGCPPDSRGGRDFLQWLHGSTLSETADAPQPTGV